MISKASGSSPLASLSQDLLPLSLFLSPLDPCGQVPLLVPSFSFPSICLMTLLYPQPPSTNYFTEFHFPLKLLSPPFLWTCQKWPSSNNPSEDQEVKHLNCCQRFPKVTEDLHRFADKFNMVTQIDQPGFSELNQLVHMLVGKGRAWYFCCSVTLLCPTIYDARDCSTPGFPVLHYLMEFTQTHVHWVHDAEGGKEQAELTPSWKRRKLHLALSVSFGLCAW